MVWQVADCAAVHQQAQELFAHASRFCRAGRGVEVSCDAAEPLLRAADLFRRNAEDAGVMVKCWPLALVCVIVLVLLDHPSAPDIDGPLAADAKDPGKPLRLDAATPSTTGSLAHLLASAERAGTADNQGLQLSVSSFDLRAGGLPFFSTERPLRKLLRFHRQFFSVHMSSCAGLRASDSAAQRGTFALKAPISTINIPCATGSSEAMIIKRCVDRKRLLQRSAQNRTSTVPLRCPAEVRGDQPESLELSDLRGAAALGKVTWPRGAQHVAPWLGREDLTTSLAHLPKSPLLLQLPWYYGADANDASGRRGLIAFRSSLHAEVLVGLYGLKAAGVSSWSDALRQLGLEPVPGKEVGGLLLSDGSLINFGRSRVQAGEMFTMPDGPGQAMVLVVPDEEDFHWTRGKWNLRFRQGWCEPNYGDNPDYYSWLTGPVMRSLNKCSLTVILDWINPPPGGWFLDWASACGHKLVWAKQLYGLRVVGVDTQRESVEWAKQHAPALDLVCTADGRDLSWLPDDFFDGALAFGAIYALSLVEQCATVIQIARKLRRGGRAVMGYMAPNINPLTSDGRKLKLAHMVPAYESWHECFQGRGIWSEIGGLPNNVQLHHDVMLESSWYLGVSSSDSASIERETLQSYALLITRL